MDSEAEGIRDVTSFQPDVNSTRYPVTTPSRPSIALQSSVQNREEEERDITTEEMVTPPRAEEELLMTSPSAPTLMSPVTSAEKELVATNAEDQPLEALLSEVFGDVTPPKSTLSEMTSAEVSLPPPLSPSPSFSTSSSEVTEADKTKKRLLSPDESSSRLPPMKFRRLGENWIPETWSNTTVSPSPPVPRPVSANVTITPPPVTPTPPRRVTRARAAKQRKNLID